jgi:hypothetical protein
VGCPHPSSSGTGAAIPRISCPKSSAACLCHFPKLPRSIPAGIQLVKKKGLFCVFALVNLFPTWSHLRQCRMLNRSSSHVFTAKSSSRKTGCSNRLNPLVL